VQVYITKVICAICGGPGLARPSDAAQEWLGAELVHQDPWQCRYYLQLERKKAEGQNE
jgi:hypothetical protein